MTTQCTQCGAPLPVPPANPTCPNCAETAAADTPMADADSNTPRWGIGPPTLGILALAPTAILVSLLALTMTLAMATVISALTLGIVQIALAWTLALRAWPPRLSPFGLTRPARTPLKVATATVAAIAASLTFAWLYGMATSALATQFGWNWLTPPELPAGLLLPGPALAASVLALVIWTPLAEEIFFRGFLMRGIANRWGLAARPAGIGGRIRHPAPRPWPAAPDIRNGPAAWRPQRLHPFPLAAHRRTRRPKRPRRPRHRRQLVAPAGNAIVTIRHPQSPSNAIPTIRHL